ncbi:MULTISPECIES: hypothetical protein [Nannocystis]|uniref:Uncharacterized protein n=2 Tax=Nannocystis TaxID=53 RepID=A0ABS7TQI0_9BACT|nr:MULTISPECIES: hypothetical protein [Nannocystis]MBZ5710489.1 hypothetical protein [Nannocystis pusilla]MCY1062719.1 hypothetical protein [Nannocystis sp. SCPEA4]MDC0674481.1 hypothetical protein [Nannocystis radixulma]
MRSIRSFSVIAIALSFGAIAFGARTAQANICCSAPICQQDFPPSLCDRCTPTCAEDEAPAAAEIVYDDAEQLCYVAGDAI